MRLITCILLIFMVNILTAQFKDLTIEIPEGAKPWSSLDLNNDSDQFQIAIVTDRTGGHRPGVFMDGIQKLNLLQPEFVMSVGDLIEGYTEDLDQLNREWKEFNGFIDNLQMPFFYVPGNHDITNKVMYDLYLEKFGKTYYHFVYKDVLFLCLNSEDRYRGAGKGSISDKQFEYIKETLDDNQDVRWTLIFMHQPLWNQNDPIRWPDVEKLLAGRKHTVFTGHVHHYAKYDRNNGNYFTLATTGGGSSLRGPALGEFDHVTWLTMTEEGPVLANLLLEGIWNEDVSTERTRAYVQKVLRSNAIQFEPIYVPEGPWVMGTLKLKLTNDLDVPMKIKFKDGFSWDIDASLNKTEYLLQPNSVEITDINLRNKRSSKRLDGSRPVKLKTEISLLSDDLPSFSVPMEFMLRPEIEYALLRTNSAPKIDGDLSDWASLSYKIPAMGADCSADFGIRFDSNYVYIAIQVNDDNVQANSESTVWNQDFAGIVMNADPPSQSAQDRGAGWYKNSMFFLQSPNGTVDEEISNLKDLNIDGMISKCIPNKMGYSMETAIPISYIIERQGEDWKTVRINMVIQDKDKDQKEMPRFTFEPDWRSTTNRPGSGMFFRKE